MVSGVGGCAVFVASMGLFAEVLVGVGADFADGAMVAVPFVFGGGCLAEDAAPGLWFCGCCGPWSFYGHVIGDEGAGGLEAIDDDLLSERAGLEGIEFFLGEDVLHGDYSIRVMVWKSVSMEPPMGRVRTWSRKNHLASAVEPGMHLAQVSQSGAVVSVNSCGLVAVCLKILWVNRNFMVGGYLISTWASSKLVVHPTSVTYFPGTLLRFWTMSQ